MGNNRELISHVKRKAHDLLRGPQAEYEKQEELTDKYRELADGYKTLVEDVGKAGRELLEYSRECKRLYCAAGPEYEENAVLQAAFSGEGSILYYVDYFMDACRRRAPVEEDAESTELFAYKNILSMIRIKLEDIKEKLKRIPVYDEQSFERYYDIHIDPEALEKTPVYVVCDARGLEYEEYGTVRKMYRQMKRETAILEKTKEKYREDMDYLTRIKEEWDNRKEYLDTGKAKEYRVLYRKLQEIPWDAYALQENEDADAYKSRLFELAGMLKGLAGIIL